MKCDSQSQTCLICRPNLLKYALRDGYTTEHVKVSGAASAEAHNYVCRLLFQAQMCGAMFPVDLSLERLTTRFSVNRQSMPFLKFN